MTIRTFDGTYNPESFIKDITNPWVEVDGVPVNWMQRPDLPRTPCPCGYHDEVILPGVLDAMDSPQGVQRCDACDTYAGDLDAALALAKLVGGVVKYEEAE